MAKLKNPLLSIRSSGILARSLVFLRRRGVDLVEKKPEIKDVRSDPQLGWRTMFNLCVDLWHLLSAAEKAEWESAARSRHMTGYAWYISQCLRPNPGIYLPLQGGTMSGDIDMAKNKIEKLPAPSDSQEAANKAYVDAVDRGEGHIVLFPWNYNTIVQGLWGWIPTAWGWGRFYFRTSPALDGNAIAWKAYLAKGTYTIRILTSKSPGACIADFDIDGVEVASWDLYIGATVHNQTLTDTGNVVATPGLKTITMRADGKNALSTGFALEINALSLWRTA